MRKHFKLAAIALTLAVLMAVLSPMQAFAASQKTYISDIRMADSVEKLKDLGYTVLEKDLNAGTTEADVYIGYKTTTDPKEAITDISVMDMKGGYSFGDYEEMLKRQKDLVNEQLYIYRTAINEFRQRYNDGEPAAKLAYASLNNYKEDDSGKLVGDLFLDETLSDEVLVKMIMEGTVLFGTVMSMCLSIGLGASGNESWLDKLSKVGKVEKDYYDDANDLLTAAESIRSIMEDYRNAGVNAENEEEVKAFIAENSDDTVSSFMNGLSIYGALSNVKYGTGTVADLFLNPDLTAEDLYPVISVLSPGQIAVAKLAGFEGLIKAAVNNSASIESATKEIDESGCKVVSDEKISVYTGVDRSMFQGGVALTSDAKRKAASTGDNSWYYGNANEYAEFTTLVLGGVAATTSIISAGTLLYLRFALPAAEQAYQTSGLGLFMTAVEKQADRVLLNSITNMRLIKPGMVVALYVSLAIAFVAVCVYFTMEIISYYNPDYTEIPLILMDLKFGEDEDSTEWEKYIRYDVVRDENGEAGDLNHFEAKQWNAMYTTKDRAAGDPVTVDSLTVKYGDSATPRGYSPVHYFGSTDAFDLNSHCYNNNVDGVFVFFQRDAKAFATETASVFGSGALAIITGFGGLVIGALGAVLITKKKKTPEHA